MRQPIELTILLGRTHRADVAIEDFWQRAQSAVSDSGVLVNCLAIHAVASNGADELAHEKVKIVRLVLPSNGPCIEMADRWAAKPGPQGIVGRLVQQNLASRKVAKALGRNRWLAESMCASDLIVAADPEADRAVWKLRNKTDAPLLHGPFAMANALTILSST